MGTTNVKIVGMQHRNLSATFSNNLYADRIKLVPEPHNKHDRYAVMCIFDGTHFGYIEKEKSALIAQLIKHSTSYKIEIVKKDEFVINIRLTVEPKINEVEFVKLANGDISGIYEIQYMYNGNRFKYIGQSVNINNRLRQHYNDLANFTHHNKWLQEAWSKSSHSFQCKVLDSLPANISPLHQQFRLFQLELNRITEAGDSCVNAIPGDLVLTADALVELDKLIQFLKKRMKYKRIVLSYEKEKLCDLILDVGILKRHKISGNEIKSSNVLSWLNKDSWSVFDYRPNIDSGHRLYSPLVKALRDQQQKIVTVDSDKKYIDKFRENASDKNKYETCDMKSLQIFLKIVDTYKSVSDASVVLAQYRTVNHPRVQYDSCLNNLLGTSTIALL
jgi:hypothetical protein